MVTKSECLLIFHVLFFLLGLLHVTQCQSDYSKQPDVQRYEQALMEEMAKLKKMPAGDDEKQRDNMKEAMDRVEHLKPPNMPVEELIGLMSRLFQSQMGGNFKVQAESDPEKIRKLQEEKEKEGKKKKKEKKEKKKGPSLSRSGEL